MVKREKVRSKKGKIVPKKLILEGKERRINGKKYIVYGIPSPYILFEPKDPKDEWLIKVY